MHDDRDGLPGSAGAALDYDDPRRHPRASRLEAVLVVGLSTTVLVGTLAVVRTASRISGAMSHALVDRVAEPDRTRTVPTRTPPSLICLVSIGGLRADRWSYDGPLAGFAAEAVRFDTILAQASHPLVSLKSLLTGDRPTTSILLETAADLPVLATLPDPATFLEETFAGVEPTLASELQGHGYRTAAWTSGPTMTREANFSLGFDAFDGAREDLDASVDAALAWLAGPGDGRAFVLVHAELDVDAARYDDDLDDAQRSLARFFEGLGELGRWERALIAVTAEHGASLDERRGITTGDLYLEQLHVPLAIKFPNSWSAAGKRIGAPLELVDLFPTLLEAAGVRRGRSHLENDGVSMLPVVFRGVRVRKHLVAETTWTSAGANAARRTAIVPGQWQVIHDAVTDVAEYYALDEDPAGLVPCAPEGERVPEFVERLRADSAVEFVVPVGPSPLGPAAAPDAGTSTDGPLR